MSVTQRPSLPKKILATVIRALRDMPESRLTVLTNFGISVYILTLIYTGDVGGFIGVSGVVAINGVTSGLLYSLGRAIEEAEKRQETP